MSIYNIKKKIIKNLGANAYGQLITILIQLVSVPFFLKYWGVELYGEWLLIVAIPTYLAFTDVGLATVTGNDLSIKMAVDDKQGVIAVYQSAWLFICCISFLLMFIIGVIIYAIDFKGLLNLRFLETRETRVVLGFYALYVLVGLHVGILNAAFKCIGLYAFSAYVSNTVRLLEWGCQLALLILGYGVIYLAIVPVLTRLLGLFVLYFDLVRRASFFRFNFHRASFLEIRRLIKPAVAFMAFPVGSAIMIQGMTILVGINLGGGAVAIFSIYRTLTRLIVQLITMINQSAWPEISVAYGKKDFILIRDLHRKISFISFWSAFAISVFTAIFGEVFLQAWTGHKYLESTNFLYVMLAAAFLNISWQASWVVLMAINQHTRMAAFFLVAAMLSIGMAFVLSNVFGLVGIGFALVLVEIPTMVYSVNRVMIVVGDNWRGFIVSHFQKIR